MERPQKKRKWTFERQLIAYVCLAGLPGGAAALLLLWYGDYTATTRWSIAALVMLTWCSAVYYLRERVIRHLQTLSNALGALREGDFSIRVRGSQSGDALGELIREVNALGEMLREQRIGAVEAHALLRAVLSEIDVAIFTFDDSQLLRLTNRAGERLLGRPKESLLGRSAKELGLIDFISGEHPSTVEVAFPGGIGRWGLRQTTFREAGKRHQLIVLNDLSRTLRDEERTAWQRLLRVLSHELNNTLAPIRSISGSLRKIINLKPLPDDWQQDVEQGLSIISGRSDSLHRFIEGYSRLARLPQPRPAPVAIDKIIRRVAGMETRKQVRLLPGADLTIHADEDQLEQLLINLLRNAVDAALESGGGVTIGWSKEGSFVEILIEDEGQGIANPANVFVPFFTTKENGTGIGLVLSRQIAEAHGGTLGLKNRETGPGCEARLRLPL